MPGRLQLADHLPGDAALHALVGQLLRRGGTVNVVGTIPPGVKVELKDADFLAHIAAYCRDLGYGAARGAQKLWLMLATAMVSRPASSLICDRIGGMRTLLQGNCRLWRAAHLVHALTHIAGRCGNGQGVRTPRCGVMRPANEAQFSIAKKHPIDPG